MVEIEYEILCHIEKQGGCRWTETITAVSSSESASVVDRTLKAMVSEGLLSCSGFELSSFYLRITPKGTLKKKVYEERRDKEAEAKREDERKEKEASRLAVKIAWIGVVGTIIAALISVVVPFFLAA